MEITDTGVSVDSLIDAVKAAVKEAGISAGDAGRALRVVSIQLNLNAVATTTAGAKLEFKIPFIGMNVKLGGASTTKNTHTIDVTLVPPDLAPGHEIRDGGVDAVLVEAIETILALVDRAAGGDDPFVLKESTVELSFAITETGSISLGVDRDAADEVTHKLKITLGAVAR
ncbi:trypco2 family protein [Amycolatopsis rifamycinica]|uniref:Trypsin-co-occurring domain-containing protein n=1 Tax=Amycolatopsis rifamycinica TaxID=287986 RepID=A0A066TVL1_9PSEU|nr:trypco2 family protein [Amycolatopsis rifamycinica]KDN17602.1 hypothetical protein DV20_35335 [Amycolatopsis rifamycinica]